MTEVKIEPKQDQVAASPDGFGLGASQGQRSAEAVAAIREERMPSPETKALSRWSARIFVKLGSSLLKKETVEELFNYLFIRNEGMRILCNKAIEGKEKPIFVDIASGFSPRALFLAREAPHLRVIEIDQESVIQEKKHRLRSKRIEIPENLEFLSADLGRVPLNQVLDGLLVDVISAEGLNSYFPPDEVIMIARGVYESLKPDGTYVSSIALREGFNEIVAAMKFGARQVGRALSIMETGDEAKQLFLDAGYDEVSLHLATDLAATYDLPTPVFNLEGLVVAKKTSATQVASTSDSKTVAEAKIASEGATAKEEAETTSTDATTTEDDSGAKNTDA